MTIKSRPAVLLSLLLPTLTIFLIGCASQEVAPPPVPPTNTLDFGDCLIGLQSNRILKIETEPVDTNAGATITSPVIAGADHRAFRHGITEASITIAPMQKHVTPMIFTPVALRSHTANFHVETVQGEIWGKTPFTLRGEGKYRIHVGDLEIVDDIHKKESLLAFGNSFINPANPPKNSIVIRNKGAAERHCHVYFGNPSGEFRLQKGQSTKFSIPAGGKHTLNLEFHPKKAENYQVPVLVEDINQSGHRTGVVLTGIGRY